MAEPEVRVGAAQAERPEDDVDMGGAYGDGDTEVVGDTQELLDAAPTGEENEQDNTTASAPKPSFIDYLRSSPVQISVGSAENAVVLTAHRALLERSPFFSESLASLGEPTEGALRVDFPEADLTSMGSFLQFLYTGEYFPRRIGDGIEMLPALAGGDGVDPDGDELLRHARVYTLADKLGVRELKELAHAKVHRVSSTARGEVAYARYIYANTPKYDTLIRRPIASFWGQRSHVLRHEAEDEFKQLCLEFPDFGYDVLSYVLDTRERREKERGKEKAPEEGKGSVRKRMRHI